MVKNLFAKFPKFKVWQITLFVLSLSAAAVLVLAQPSEREGFYADADDAAYAVNDEKYAANFGSKSNDTGHKVRFEAVAEVVDISGEQVEENLNNRSLKDKAVDVLNGLVGNSEKIGLEFSLQESGIEDTEDIQLILTQHIISQLEDSPLVEEGVQAILSDSEDVDTTTKIQNGDEDVAYIVNKDVAEGVDIRYSVIEGKGIKEEIVIHKIEKLNSDCLESVKGTPEELSARCGLPKNKYTFDLKLDEGVELKRDLEKNVWYLTDEYGRYIAHFEGLFAEDANGGKTNDVRLNIVPHSDPLLKGEGEIQMVVTVNLKWMLSPSRVYPIIIDPSIVHDTEVEFNAGTPNRLEVTGDPKVQLAYHELPADEHVVGLWHMNNNWSDSSGNSNTLTATNSPTFTSSTNLGSHAGSFVATSSQYVTRMYDADFDFGTDSFTVESWFKHDTITAVDYIISRYDADQGFKVWMDDSGDMCFGIDDDATWDPDDSVCTSGIDYDDDEWHYVGGVKDGTTAIRLYVDGKEVASKVGLTAIATLTSNSAPFTIASDEPTNGSYWDGQIDDVRISNRALTPEEIKSNAQRRPYGVYTSDTLDLGTDITSIDSLQWGEYGATTGDGEILYSSINLVAQWNFNETSGTVADNAEGTALNDGTLTGFSDTTGQDVVVSSGWTADNKKWGAGALMFDGTDDFVNCGNDQSLRLTKDFTLVAWFYPQDATDTSIISKITNASEKQYWIHLYNNKYRFEYERSANNYFLEAGTVNLNEWNNIVVTVDSSLQINMYTNGQLISSDVAPAEVSALGDNVNIGRRGGSYNDNYFKGIIDSVSIYSRTLSAEEVLSNYQAGQIEFQTRTSADGNTWEAWSPSTSEAQILDFDSHLFNTTDTGLISYWAMDETSNNNSCNSGTYDVCDLKGNNGGIALPVDEPVIVDGVFGKARSFDGVDDYAEVSSSGALIGNSVNSTVEAWVKWNGKTSSANEFYSENDSGGPVFQVRISTTGKLEFYIRAGASWHFAVGSTTLVADKWYHAVAVLNSGTGMKVYINGIEDGSDTNTVPSDRTITNVQIGRGNSGVTVEPFGGTIDEVRVYNTALISADIYADYIEGVNQRASTNSIHPLLDESLKIEDTGSWKSTIGMPMVDTNTVALWHMDETNGDLTGVDVFDETANNNDGEFSGSGVATGVVEGTSGKAREFNGSDDKIDVSSVFGLGNTNATIESWVYLGSTSLNGIFMKIGKAVSAFPNEDGYGIGVGNGDFGSPGNELIGLYEGVRWIDTNTNIGMGWHHIALVIDVSGVPTFYIDGVSIGTFSGTNAKTPTVQSFIGGYTARGLYPRYFVPVKEENIEEHEIHSEWFSIEDKDAEVINKVREKGGKILAAGTTVTRVLETVSDKSGYVKPFTGESRIFIYPGYKFKCVDILLTNFHAPKTTVLLLAAAFASHSGGKHGKDNLLKAYKEAKAKNYKFLSYGDSMLII